MSSTANFEYDIFISYAHIDNQPLVKGLKAWVECFHEALSVKLTQLLGEEVKIWRDLKLQGNDVFADTLIEHIEKAAILVSVISPRYVKSEWCMREFNEFCRLAEMSTGVQIGDKLRVFKVVKTYIPYEKHPPLLQDTLGYEFYEYDQVRKQATEFSPEIVPAPDMRYWQRLNDLANELNQMIETMRHSSVPASVPASDFRFRSDNLPGRYDFRPHRTEGQNQARIAAARPHCPAR